MLHIFSYLKTDFSKQVSVHTPTFINVAQVLQNGMEVPWVNLVFVFSGILSEKEVTFQTI